MFFIHKHIKTRNMSRYIAMLLKLLGPATIQYLYASYSVSVNQWKIFVQKSIYCKLLWSFWYAFSYGLPSIQSDRCKRSLDDDFLESNKQKCVYIVQICLASIGDSTIIKQYEIFFKISQRNRLSTWINTFNMNGCLNYRLILYKVLNFFRFILPAN